MDYFISDIHFGHKNVIRFCNRPFSTAREMNEGIIDNWNNVVSDRDRVFVVGDVFICDPEEAKAYIEELNGYKVLIKGNHDYGEKVMLNCGFDEFHKSLDYKLPDGRLALLNHYPVPDCKIDSKYDVLIHGHVHLGDRSRGKKINVSCDIWDYRPISVDTLCEIPLIDIGYDEVVDIFIDRDGALRVDLKIHAEDFSGASSFVYDFLNKNWNNRKEK
ncbi:phosphoesterase [bacterium]|nr:phosphoesterase [bacterium]